MLDDQPLAVGLLAHEVSHFLQPLAAIGRNRQRQSRYPKWLVNVVIDIQGEALMESIFPSLHQPLTVCRQAVADACIPEYEREIAGADSFARGCRLACLVGSLPRSGVALYAPHSGGMGAAALRRRSRPSS